MTAIKAIYNNGAIQLSEPPPNLPGPLEVLIIFPSDESAFNLSEEIRLWDTISDLDFQKFEEHLNE